MNIQSRGKYLDIKIEGHPMADARGRILYHRYVMACHLGRYLTKDEIVHHKDENTRNNELLNLELTNAADHTRHHLHSVPIAAAILTCEWCGISFERLARSVRKSKTKRKFCCISHGVLFQQCESRGGSEEISHGQFGRYRKGCRCDLCRRANADQMKLERHRRKLRGIA